MQTWEYDTVYIGPESNIPGKTLEILNDAGSKGWEVVTLLEDSQGDPVYLLKRPSQMRGNNDPKPVPLTHSCSCHRRETRCFVCKELDCQALGVVR